MSDDHVPGRLGRRNSLRLAFDSGTSIEAAMDQLLARDLDAEGFVPRAQKAADK